MLLQERELQNSAKHVQELEATVSVLQEEIDESKNVLSTDGLKLQKSKKGFFANLKYTVADVPKNTSGKNSDKKCLLLLHKKQSPSDTK